MPVRTAVGRVSTLLLLRLPVLRLLRWCYSQHDLQQLPWPVRCCQLDHMILQRPRKRLQQSVTVLGHRPGAAGRFAGLQQRHKLHRPLLNCRPPACWQCHAHGLQVCSSPG
jgi:hypothetical protein